MKKPLPKTALIIEDETGLRLSMAETLESIGFEVRACAGAEEGLELAASFKPTLVFCDVHLEQGDGRTVLAQLRADDSLGDCQFVLMTGDWVGASERSSVDIGADAYLPKPFTFEEFRACAEERYRQANL
ncbi:MAG TPA: response regulator [Lacunisphaera sp.]|nr:response regulator [Lacunisphaera sp.]